MVPDTPTESAFPAVHAFACCIRPFLPVRLPPMVVYNVAQAFYAQTSGTTLIGLCQQHDCANGVKQFITTRKHLGSSMLTAIVNSKLSWHNTMPTLVVSDKKRRLAKFKRSFKRLNSKRQWRGWLQRTGNFGVDIEKFEKAGEDASLRFAVPVQIGDNTRRKNFIINAYRAGRPLKEYFSTAETTHFLDWSCSGPGTTALLMGECADDCRHSPPSAPPSLSPSLSPLLLPLPPP